MIQNLLLLRKISEFLEVLSDIYIQLQLWLILNMNKKVHVFVNFINLKFPLHSEMCEFSCFQIHQLKTGNFPHTRLKAQSLRRGTFKHDFVTLHLVIQRETSCVQQVLVVKTDQTQVIIQSGLFPYVFKHVMIFLRNCSCYLSQLMSLSVCVCMCSVRRTFPLLM